MSVFVMKLIAMASMLCDHAAVFLYPFHFISHPAYVYMRAVGRLAFPIFAFLIVNGYEKTRDVKRYLTRLIAFAAISQIPYVLTGDVNRHPVGSGLDVTLGEHWAVCLVLIVLACVVWFSTVRLDGSVLWLLLALSMAVLRVSYCGVRILSDHLNVFYTLALGLSAVALADRVLRPERDWVKLLAQGLALLGVFYLAGEHMDYRTLGAALILAIWLARESRFSQAGVILLWCVVEYIIPRHPMTHFLIAALSLAPILLYKGKKGPPLKLAFYAIYPAHLAVLGALTVYYTLGAAP